MARIAPAVGIALTALSLVVVGCSRKKDEVPLTTLPSGLKYADLVVGTGPEAKAGDIVTVNYIGWLQSGIKFDSSYDRNQPYEFRLGTSQIIKGWNEGIVTSQIIKGWNEGIVGMHVGGKRKLVIPPDLAYGAQGKPPSIPPFEVLTFEIELVGTK